MDTLFDAGQRSDSRPKRHDESINTFLARRAGEDWARVRDLLEDWLNAIPVESRVDLAERLRSGKDREFRGAFLELYCHQILVRSGWDARPHPDIVGR